MGGGWEVGDGEIMECETKTRSNLNNMCKIVQLDIQMASLETKQGKKTGILNNEHPIYARTFYSGEILTVVIDPEARSNTP